MMKKLKSILASVAFVSLVGVSQAAVAAKAPVLCATWELGKPIQNCEFKGGTKTGRIGSAPDGYGEKWNTLPDQSSGFPCTPEHFGGNPFEGTGYIGRLECYIE